MENQKELFKFVVVIAALFALLYVAILLSNLSTDQRGKKTADDQKNLPVQTTPLPVTELPANFPTNLPLEANAEVTENSQSVRKEDNAKQVTRSYKSSKTAAENFTIYSNYLKSNDWEILAQSNESAIKTILAKNGYQVFQVSISPSIDAKTSVVTLSVVEQ